jgi:hypothetical protein
MDLFEDVETGEPAQELGEEGVVIEDNCYLSIT